MQMLNYWQGDFASGGCRIKQLGGDAPKVSITIYFYILSFSLTSLKIK
jgi:hypothetical protein